MTKQELLKELDTMVTAMINISENWDRHLDVEYPFERSFDEVTADVLTWILEYRGVK